MRLASLLLLLLAAGCTKYEFDVVEPGEFATHVGRTREAQAVINRDPILYRMQAAEGHLVVFVENKSDEALELLGQKSYVVDPAGESHPLRGQTIAPGSYIKLILPPLAPVYRTSPSFGIGVGVGISHHHRHGYYGGDIYHPIYGEPQYLALYDESDNYYWTWTGESTVTVHLAHQRAGDVLHHEFAIRRVRAK